MKKILLTTTALVAAGFLSSAALADSASDSFDTSSKPAGISLGLGGYYKAAAGFVDSDLQSAREYAVQHDVEVYFTGETTLDNGLTVGARIELDTDDSSATTETKADERYAYFRGSWGELRAGNEDSARRLLSVQAPEPSSVFSSGDGYINMKELDLATGVATFDNLVGIGFDGENDTVADLEGDDAKLIYFTPSFNGLTLGVSFTPEVGRDGTAVSNGVSGNDQTTEGDVISLAALYEGDFDGVGVKASLGYESTDGGKAGGTAAGAQVDDRDALAFGLQFNVSEWYFGGSYGMFDDFSTTTGAAVTESDLEFDVYDLGVVWAPGDYSVGLSYSSGDYEATTGGAEVELDTWQVSGAYTLGQGIDLVGAIQFNDLDADGITGITAAEADQESTAVLVGTDIRF